MEENQNQNGQGSTTEAGNVNQDWREVLPPDLKAEKTFEKFKVGEGETLVPMPLSLAKSYIDAEKATSRALNAKGVIIPGEKATQEEWDNYYNSLGRPKTPDEYGLAKPEDLPEGMTYDEERTKAFAKLAHSVGLTAKQLSALHEGWNNIEKENFSRQLKEGETFRENTTATLKKEWGKDFDANLAKADGVIDNIFGADFKKMLIETGLKDHPGMIKGLFKAAQSISEHGFVNKGGQQYSQGTYTKEELRAKMRDVRYSGDPAQKDQHYINTVMQYAEELAKQEGAKG